MSQMISQPTAVTSDDAGVSQVRLALGDVLSSVHPTLRPCLGAAFVGGKLLRPMIARSWFHAAGGRGDAWCLPGAAVELVHRASLAHDDLPCMDDELKRRGQPTLHVRFGEDAAVLAGDAMISLAFELLVRGNATPGMFAVLSRTITAMCGGQLAELRQTSGRTSIAEDKTGSLFVAAAELGLRAAGTPSPALVGLAEDFGCTLGRLYQGIDDLIDGDALPIEPAALNADLAHLSGLADAVPHPEALRPFMDVVRSLVPHPAS